MSGWYLDGKEQLFARTIPEAATVRMVGVNEDYVFDATHVDFTPITPFIILPEATLENVTFTGGLLRADPYKWIQAGLGFDEGVSLVLKGVVVYFQLDDAGTLLSYVDSAILGLPQTLSGVNVTGQWPNGICRL